MIEIFSPGRVNIIGEHTDHQGGLVLPGCIQYGIRFQGNQTDNGLIKVISHDMADEFTFDPQNMKKQNNWVDYIQGAVFYFTKETGIVPSFKISLKSNLQIASGLSSSAALEVGIIKFLDILYRTKLAAKKIASLARLAENNYVGVKCGIMDQSIIARSLNDTAYLLDCTTLEMEEVRLPSDLVFLLVDTKIRRSLTSSKFNERLEELDLIKQELEKLNLTLQGLQMLPPEDREPIFTQLKEFYPIETKRLIHVITENDRVDQYKQLIAESNYKAAGKQLIASHRSLQHQFDASWSRADEIIQWVEGHINIVHGGRMVGAGWGGNVLVQTLKSDEQKVINELKEIDWIEQDMITVLSIRKGVELLE